MLVSEAVFYYWMTSREETLQQNMKLRLINEKYLEELRTLRAKTGLLDRLKRLLRKRE